MNLDFTAILWEHNPDAQPPALRSGAEVPPA